MAIEPTKDLHFKQDDINKRIHFRHQLGRWIGGILILIFSIIYIFPIIFMFCAGFMTELQAVQSTLIWTPTLKTYEYVLTRTNVIPYFRNSAILAIGSTVVCTVLGTIASFSICFSIYKKMTTGETIYNWFFTTILLPPVAIIVPAYLVLKGLGVFGQLWTILLLYIGFHLPLAIWLIHSFLAEVPYEIIEAARIDGASSTRQLWSIVVPIARTGIITAALLIFVFTWNEFFLGYQLSDVNSASMPVYLARFREKEGLNVAQMSASCTVACLPPLVAGWVSQKSLMKGLTAGAVKG